jgi:hypothetical protein
MAGSTFQVEKPMSIREIAAKAQDFDFNAFIAPKYWLRTAETLLREVRTEFEEGRRVLIFGRHKSTNESIMINKPISSLCDILPSSLISFQRIRLPGFPRIGKG